jgi:Terminase large subunit, T4likevirus-type, N-terminal
VPLPSRRTWKGSWKVAEHQEIIWAPQEGPQTLLLSCPVFEIFYGGARGGGKTESSIGDWLQHSNEWGEHAIGIFFRRKLVQLAEVIARTKVLFPKLGAKYNEQQKTWVMRNGARLKFAYLERDSDAEEYQGHSYTRIYIEELTNFPSPGPINKLRATLRSAVAPTGMRLTGNPGGPGHNWVKARYIDPDTKGFRIITESTEIEIDGIKRTVSLDRVFIPSKLGDNQLLMRGDPTYVLRLRQSGSEQLVKAWLDGNWDVVDGAFFDCWDEEKHVLPSRVWMKCIPRNAQVFRAFDWGSYRPFSVGWYVISDGTWGLPKGALLKFLEWYGSSGPNKGLKMTADLVAVGIRERELQLRKEWGLSCTTGVADPAIYIRDGGPSIGETMAVKGISWRRADNKRKAGAEQLRQRLMGDGDIPMLYFLDTCEDTIRTLPTLQHDDTDVEDVDTEGEDHAYDETRYACMSRPWLRGAPALAGSGLPRLPSETTINELVAKLRQKRLTASEF